ncbi:CoA transferase [Bosea sp. (in: a-proteobacteria)]|jgi:crotonobetainyl-CoA:carnitine CoA-transferase CaiB-like acyl-CoA transferase|uniref:CaiB/BaiF CoA transferase family protein n=1 Tax=Bosea sp. (in: a-proteobacteria) TaxID=1871050 RepID=UPI002DDC9AD1|nr:CoA transferase [Bosea sp. (in: a-proteobacteria)]HEV2512252.1 CoA transferase [Bosea sp. (in: a-proteobacteria)]
MTAARPLAGIRVLDAATFIAAPFCGTILADFGAEVIKIEQPGSGDPLRKFGTVTECGDSLVWLSEARNKKSLTLDLGTPAGAEVFRQLAAKSQVVLENFRPGTFEKWGLGFEALKAVNPELILLRISAYGQTGPYRGKPGFARIAHAFSGLSFLAGEPGRAPVMPGSTSLADYMSGMWGAIGVMMALRTVDQVGGQVIDLGLYESVFRVLDEIAPAYDKYGVVRERLGADTINVVPHSHYPTRDGWVAIACSSEKMFERLSRVIGRPELAQQPEYATMQARLARREEVNAIVQGWTSTRTTAQVMAACEAGELPCGPLNSIADIFEDPQYAARENMARTATRAGEIVLPTAIPKLSETPPAFEHAGPALGEHTNEILGRILGMTEHEIGALRAAGAV